MLRVNEEFNELFKYQHYLGNILAISRVSMVVGKEKGCLFQCMCMIHVPLSNQHLVKFQPSHADKKNIHKSA